MEDIGKSIEEAYFHKHPLSYRPGDPNQLQHLQLLNRVDPELLGTAIDAAAAGTAPKFDDYKPLTKHGEGWPAGVARLYEAFLAEEGISHPKAKSTLTAWALPKKPGTLTLDCSENLFVVREGGQKVGTFLHHAHMSHSQYDQTHKLGCRLRAGCRGKETTLRFEIYPKENWVPPNSLACLLNEDGRPITTKRAAAFIASLGEALENQFQQVLYTVDENDTTVQVDSRIELARHFAENRSPKLAAVLASVEVYWKAFTVQDQRAMVAARADIAEIAKTPEGAGASITAQHTLEVRNEDPKWKNGLRDFATPYKRSSQIALIKECLAGFSPIPVAPDVGL